jgi:hypothetical protein
MKRHHSLGLFIVSACVQVGCSGAAGGGSGDGGTSGRSSGGASSGSSSGAQNFAGDDGGSGFSFSGTSSDGVSLMVDSAASPGTIGGFGPQSGSFYVVVDLTLKNTGASMPVPADGVFFSLQTAQNLVVTSSAAQPSMACSASVSVASGGQIECQVAFEVPSGQTASTLKYDDLHGDTTSAAMPMIAVPSAACMTYIGWEAGSHSSACLQCLLNASDAPDSGMTGPCYAASRAYGTSCGGADAGVTTCTNFADVCSCEVAVDSASCHTLFDTAIACVVSSCGSSCP